MLCFFPRLRDLENCRSLGSSNNGDVSVVHVRKSFPGGAKADWYGCIFPSVGAGDLTAEFKSRFETMSNNGLYEVWNEKKDWGKSFDTLSEASSSGVVVNDCSFLLDSVSWPPLTGAKSGMKSAGWEICNVQALTEILSALRMNDAEPAAAAEGWEVLQHSPSQDDPVYVPASDVPPDFFGSPTKPVSSSAESATIATCGTVRSYRDALLKASGGPAAGDAQAEAEAERARKRVATTSAWRPAIVVQNLKYEHKDKLYQHNLVAKGIDPNAMYEEEDDGGCGKRLINSIVAFSSVPCSLRSPFILI